MSNLSQIKNFTGGSSVIRSGTIIVVNIDGKILFLMGVDAKSLDICDFGGGVRKRSNESVIGGTYRELREESLANFGHIENYSNQYLIAEDKTMIIFLYTKMTKEEALANHVEFENRTRTEIDPEVISFAWFDTKDFLHMIFKTRKMYKKNRDFLKRNSGDLFTYIRLVDPSSVSLIKEYEKIETDIGETKKD